MYAITTARSLRVTTQRDIVRSVWCESRLRAALGKDADRLLDDATEANVGAGEVFCEVRDGYAPPPLAMIVSGLARVYSTSSQGRQVTVRYVANGDVIGLPVLLAPGIVKPGTTLAVQALEPCHFLKISMRKFREVAVSDPQNMWPLLQELAVSMMDGYNLLSQNVFQPVRARVARHLLDLSHIDGNQSVVNASQQTIADAIGSVREVVSRVIVQLRDNGIIRREDGHYIICDIRRLHVAATEND
jgi:CRP-like cAMP-binding protein